MNTGLHRGDGVGIEIAGNVIRGVRLRHDIEQRLSIAAEFPVDLADDNSTLDALVLLRAELGEPHEPVRIATFPAHSMIQRVDAALTTVSSLRSTFGAVQNRFESTIANLQTTSENLSASRSRIQDADFAEETAALTRAQILQQAGVAMLAQANALPQNVLSLLR